MKKSYLQWLFCTLLFVFFACTLNGGRPTLMEDTEQRILQEAQQLPHQGILASNGEGFIYLKVNNDYINKLSSLVEEKGFIPPPYFRRPNSPGAHISVFYESEAHGWGRIPELGQTFSFTPEKVSIVRSGRFYYLVLQVQAPELEKLRQHYGLSPKLQGHEFHITIARKKAFKRSS